MTTMLITQVKKKIVKKPINFKVDLEEHKQLQEQADKYAGGNLSEWLRFAGKHFKPSKEHLVQSKKK